MEIYNKDNYENENNVENEIYGYNNIQNIIYEPIESETIEISKVENNTTKKNKTKFMAFALIAIIASSTFGFLGGYIANRTSKPVTGIVQANLQPTNNNIQQTNSLSPIVSATENSVVEIEITSISSNFMGQQQSSSSSGSGVVITADGYIVTNNHVIDGASSIIVRLKSGEEHKATLIGKDVNTDLAVLKIEATGLSAAVFGTSENLKVGDLAIAIGNPLGKLGGTVTNGIISALNRKITIDGIEMNLLQTSAAVSPGNSGGGLFDQNGNLVGVVNAKSTGTGVEGLGFAIPIDIAKEVIQKIINGEISNGNQNGDSKVLLGVQLVELNSQSQGFFSGLSGGVYVSGVTENSAAQKAGIQAGDMIAQFDGVVIQNISQISSIMSKKVSGDAVQLQIIRNGRKLTLTAIL